MDYATRAADAAEGRLAYEDAAPLYAKAIDALELAPEPDDGAPARAPARAR